MSDYNSVNGTGENKIQEMSPSAKDESPKAGDQKSPKKSPYKEEPPQQVLGKDKSPKVSVENTPEKDKGGMPKCFASTPDKDKASDQKSPKKSPYKEEPPQQVLGKDKSPKVSVENNPEKDEGEMPKCSANTPDKDKTGKKSPKDFSNIMDDPDLKSESFPEETSSDILGEDTPEKDKSSQSFDLSSGDAILEESKQLLSSKPHLISEGTVPAEKKAATNKLLESPEKRKLRVNRRGFRVQGASLGDSGVPKSEKPDKTSIVNLDVSKKIISLSSVKKTDNIPVDKDKKKIVLKRKLSLSTEEEEKNEPAKGADDPPKKKKHKPITWP